MTEDQTTFEAELRPLYERLVAARAKRDAISSRQKTVEQAMAFDDAQDEVMAAMAAISAAKGKIAA